MATPVQEQGPFELDPSMQQVGDPTEVGQAVQLPFLAMKFYWNNGSKQADSGVRKLGGWAISEENYNLWLTQYEDFPTGLTGPHDWTGRMSDAMYTVYAVRYVWVIPVLRRSRWFLKRDGDAANKKDWKSSVEYLCYSATVDTKAMIVTPLGPMILGAKSNAGLSLDAAFKEFKSKTAQPRKDIAGNMPSHLFYRPMGTFTETGNYQKVGEGQNSNFITPVENYFPKDFTREYLRLTFAAKDIQAIIATMASDGKAWADDWNNFKNKDQAAATDTPAPAAQNPIMVSEALSLGGQAVGTVDLDAGDLPF